MIALRDCFSPLFPRYLPLRSLTQKKHNNVISMSSSTPQNGVGTTATEISAETRYDRQVRLWGAATQQAIQRTHITFLHPSSQITGLCSEMAKIFVLAGVKSVTFDATQTTSEIDCNKSQNDGAGKCKSNFFIRENVSQNETVNGGSALCVLKSLQELNPLVAVTEKHQQDTIGRSAAAGEGTTNNSNNINIVHLSLRSVVEAQKRCSDAEEHHQVPPNKTVTGEKRPRDEEVVGTNANCVVSSTKENKSRTWLLLQIGMYTVCHIVDSDLLEGDDNDDLALIFARWLREQIFPAVDVTKPSHQLEALLSLPRATKVIGLTILTLASLENCSPDVRKLLRPHTMSSLVHFNEDSALQLAAQAAGVEVPVNTWITDEDRAEIAMVCMSISNSTGSNYTSTIIDNSVGGSLLAQQALNDVSAPTTTTTPAEAVGGGGGSPVPTSTRATTFFALVTSGSGIEASCN